MLKTGSSLGYEFGYRLWMDKSIVEGSSWTPDIKIVFEKRSYFVVKRSDGGGGDEIVDSERVQHGLTDEHGWLSCFWQIRHEVDYWMSRHEARELTRKAMDFARQKQKELADDDDDDDSLVPFIPIAVELDVCTVQKPGESISDVYGRALRLQHMYPSSLYAFDNQQALDLPVDDFGYLGFVRTGIQVDRVENVERTLEDWMWGVVENDEAANLDWWMEEEREADAAGNLEQIVCRLCAHKPTIGAQIARLRDCGHRFHYHCIVRWLLKCEKSCPTCRRRITYSFNRD